MNGDQKLAQDLKKSIKSFASSKHPLPGIEIEANCNALCKQLIESIHRVEYIARIRERDISPSRADPSSEIFDPLKAAIFYQQQRDIEEACWLVFLSVHFGKHGNDGWRLTRDVYGRLGNGKYWNWKNTSSRPQNFRKWLATNQTTLRKDGIPRRFGNHRKYESLNAWSNSGTGQVIETYVSWIKSFGTHQKLIQSAERYAVNNPGKSFDYLYKSMAVVQRFGRTARFDYLTMIGKLGLAKIEPRSTYLQGATGPLSGAQLLFGGNERIKLSRTELDKRLVEFGDYINVGMQVIEDSLCNWQKGPDSFIRFRG